MQTATRKVSVWLALLTLFTSIFMTPITSAFAADMTNIKAGDWVSTWHLSLLNGLHWTDTGIYKKVVDGQITFCVEHGIDIENSGSGWTPTDYSAAEKDKLAEIAYFAYQQNPTDANYGLAQIMIWEALGNELLTTDYPDYQNKKAAVLAKVAAFNTKPSFNDQNITLNVGDSITLTDTNGTLASYIEQTANTANLNITKAGNKLTLTATANSKESGKISFAKAKAANIGTSLLYGKGNQQKIAYFKLPNGNNFDLNIKVNLNGNLKAKKVDADTNKALPGAKLKFEYNGQTKEVTTGTDGYAALNDIKAGTQVKVSEVTAPNGYVNKGEIKTATITPNQTIEVVLGNKEQLGNVNLTKIGRQFGTNMFNRYYSLNGAMYGVYSTDGKKVGTITTDSTGKGTLQNLKLGNYYAVEEKAPAGYILNNEKIPFELKYAGQNVAVTATSVKATDDEQFGTATLIKEDAKTGKAPQGAASLDGAVYELHRTSNDELVDTVTIKNNQASVANLKLDDYYWIEKTAPTGYIKDTEKHAFKLAYAGQNAKTATASTTVKEQVITGGFDLIKIGNYDWHTALSSHLTGKENKSNPLANVEFTVTSNTTNKVVTTGTTDKEGYLKFTDLPYDTYTVTETKTPEGYKTADPFKVTIHQQNETHHYSVVNNVLEERLKVVKADAESGKTISRANAGFKIKSLQTGKYVSMPNLNHDGTTDTFMTNEEGYLTTTEALPYGQYELVETQAPLGYVLAKDPAKFSITGKDSDGIVTVKFTDKSQKGIVTLNKTGATPVEVTKQSTKYGEQYGFNYDYTPLAGAKFEFTASENITTADGTVHAKKGEIVATATTDANGQIKTPQLYLGKYSVKEVAAPNGFVLNDKPIDFELKYAGQNVEVTSTSLKATNDFQKLNVTVNKQAEQIKNWDKNKPTIENKAANGQVFGLFSKAGYNKGDINVPAKALVATATVKDGKATFADIQLPEGSYYVQELDAGEAYQLDDQTYDFEFKATDNTTTKNLTINGDKDTPILNKLHFNEFTFKKINETAKLVEDKGYQFTFDGNAKGAVFELLDKDKKVIQTTTIDDKSIGAFKNVPVGTFYLREKTPSATNLVLTKDLTKIVSTKTGITAYNAKGQLISQDKKQADEKAATETKETTETPEISFTLQNSLIKGTGELTKTNVSDGKVLPNTGIKILNQDGKTVVSGRTNDKGVFSFANLPAGKYQFVEYDAPKGYKINETPVDFEITKDGEIVKAQMKDEAVDTPLLRLPQTGEERNQLLSVIGVILLLITSLIVWWIHHSRKTNADFYDDEDEDDNWNNE